jgi:tetratricopeptide (TPR) repeat protein
MALTPATVDELEKSYKIWIKAVIEAHGDKVANLREELVRGSKVTDPIRNLRNESIRHWRDRDSIPTEDLGARTRLIEIAENLFSSPPQGADKRMSFAEVVQRLAEIRSSKVRSLAEIGKKLFETGVIAFEPVKVKDIAESELMLGSALFKGSIPPYCHREIDEAVVESLNQPRKKMVFLSGEPKAGKTRTLVRNLKESDLKNSWVFWLEPRGNSIEHLIRALPESKGNNVVAVLDDLQAFRFEESGGITVALLNELLEKCAVVGTVHKQLLSHWNLMFQDRSFQFSKEIQAAPPRSVQMSILEAAIDLPSALDAAEGINAQNVLGISLNPREITNLGATLAATEYLLAKAEGLRDSNDALYLAAFRSIFDARILWPEGFDLDELESLVKLHLESESNLAWDSIAWERVVKYCTEGLNANSPHAILMRTISDKNSYNLFDPLWKTLKPTSWDSSVAIEVEKDLVELGKKAGRAGYPKNALDLCLQDSGAKDAETQRFIGIWYDEVGDQTNSKHWFELASQQGDIFANYNLGILHSASGNNDEALRYWGMAYESGHADAANNIGVIWDQRGDTSKAIYYFEQAHQLGSSMGTTNLSRQMANQGRREEAEKYARLAHEANAVDGSSNLARLLTLLGKTKEAEAIASQFLRASKNKNIDPITLGIMHGILREFDLAESHYNAAISDGDSWGDLNLGLLEWHRGNFPVATKHLRSASDAGNYVARFELARILKLTGSLDEATSIFKTLVDGGHIEATLELGIIRAESENWESAENLFIQAHSKGNLSATRNLGLLYWKMEKRGEAQELLREANEAGNVSAGEILGWLLIELGLFEEARDLMETTVNSGRAESHHVIGLAYYNQGQIQQAVESLEKAHQLGVTSATETLKEIFLEIGEVERARNLGNPPEFKD